MRAFKILLTILFGFCFLAPNALAAELQLINLRCVKTEDFTGKDDVEINIYADGILVERLLNRLNDNQSWDLKGRNYRYVHSLKIEIYDLDNPIVGDEHDLLGTVNLINFPVYSARQELKYKRAHYVLDYHIMKAPGSANPPPGQAYITFSSETGVPHSACLLEFADGRKTWLGFKPVTPQKPKDKGFIDTSSRESEINHYVRLKVPDQYLRQAEQFVKNKYTSRDYELALCDCVSFTADLARVCKLRVPQTNFLPFALIQHIRQNVTYDDYDRQPYPWR